MKIYDANGDEIADVFLQNNSFTDEEIMGGHYIQIVFLSLNTIPLSIGDYITCDENVYRIRNNETVKKTETSRGWEYTVTFYAAQYDLEDVLFFLHGIPERKKNFDYYNGTASQWLDLIVENMNRTGSGWQAGTVIESVNINMSFRDKSCAAVLSDLVKELNTEYRITGKTINIGRIEYPSGGLSLGQGQGSGFRDITLTAVDETPPVTVLYPYGSDKNLTSDYGNDYLVLPGGELSIEKNVDKYGRIEQSVQFENIFPKGEFHVSDKIDNYTLKASDIDFNLTEHLIDGVEVTVTFQDGGLAGYDLAIVEGSWDNSTKQFKLKENEEENALKVPGDINFSVGDMFILTGIKMPQAYITEAEERLLDEAEKYHDTVCEKRVQLSCKCDDIFFKANNLSVSCGQMIHITSASLNIDREIRCTKVKKYLENDRSPYRYEIILSDFLKGDGLRDLIKEVQNVPDEIEKSVKPVRSFTKRTWRDTIELGEALVRKFTNFSEGVNPVFVRTMQLLIGDKRLQLCFVNSKTSPEEVDHVFTYNDTTKIFSTGAGIIQHMTLGIDALAPSRAANEYKFWDMAAYASSQLNNEGALWLYAKCSKANETGVFILSAEDLDDDNNYYYFIIGYLNSEYEETRSFVTLYGFTEILPGQVIANIFRSADGTQYINMLAKEIYFGNSQSGWSWNVDEENRFVIRGGITQSPSGATDYLGVDRGNYISGTTYYPGDLVKYTDGNIYKCIGQTTTEPTNTTYWKLVTSKGDPGDPGDPGEPGVEGQGYLYAYYPSDSLTPPDKPPSPGVIPSGWQSSPAFGNKRYIYVSQCVKTNGSWGEWSSPSLYAMKPEKGDPGPAIVLRGLFTAGEVYYNNAARRDVVKYTDGKYYIYKGTDAATVTAWAVESWELFGAQFSSVATDLLLALNANVGGWIFKNERLESVNGKTYLDGVNGIIVADSGIFKGSIGTPFVWTTYDDDDEIELSDNFNIAVRPTAGYTFTAKLPVGIEHNGKQCRIYNPYRVTSLSWNAQIGISDGRAIIGTGETYSQYMTVITIPAGKIAVFTAVINGDGDDIDWVCENYKELI
jgi:hypothetical protein